MRHLSWFAGLLIGLGALAGGPVHAQSYTYSIYVDNDASSSTGCAENGFAGAEVRLQVEAIGGTTPAIASATQSTCSGGVFGVTTPLSGGAALGANQGAAGSDVIELAVDEAFLRAGNSPLRVGVAAVSAEGIDQLYSSDGGNGPPIGFGRGAVPLPLLGAPMLVLMALLLLGFGARRARRWHLVAMLLAISGGSWAAHFVVDGQTSDWAGMSPLATDPAGDASSGETAIDLRALFAAIENHRAFFRIDLTDLQGNPVNPPVGDALAATTREDTPVTLTLTGSGPQGGALTFAITSAPLRGTLGALTPVGADRATVTYTPNPDVNGSDAFAFTVSDGQATSAPVGASLTVTPVNDAPQFTAQDPPKVSENAGPQAVLAATAIAAGPPTAVDETGQALEFVVTANDNPALFAAPPSISADGVLHYEPAAGASGSAALSVVLHDDGGTTDGGVDASTSQTITARVGAVNDVPVLSAGATLAYTENDPASVIDATLTASDPDSANLASATVRISAGYQAGADRLDFADTATISGVWDSASARLTLSGDDTVANYQAALRTVTYVNTSDDPTTQARTVTWIASDGSAASAPVTSTITVAAVNDAPTISAGGTLAYAEGDPPAPIDATVTVSDADDADLAGATVQIGAGYAMGEDVLALASSGGISAGFDAASGTLTLSGTASLAAYQAALRAVTYANISKDPSLAPRTVSWRASDASAASNVATSTITVTAVKNAPVLGAGATLAYTENDPASIIDATLTARDPDSANLAGATVQISAGYQDGADRLGFVDTAKISGVWDSASASLTLSGDDTVANYQAALRTVTYLNTSDDPTTQARTVTWIASDGSASSAPVTSTITVVAVNDPPTLAGGVSLGYTENDPATPVDPTLTVTDADSTDLAGATVQISAGYAMGEDVLALASSGAISASFDAASGTLTLSGIDSLAHYEAALRGVTYVNLSQNPSTAPRTLSFQVSDGALASNVLDSSVDVVAVNDAPVLTAGAAVTYSEGDPPVIADATLTVGDVDNATLAGASVQITAQFGGTQDLLAFTPVGAISGSYDAATGTLALSGTDTIANYQTALRSVTYRNTSQNPSTGTRTLSWSATDGAATSAVVTSTVAIVAVNSAPSYTKGADQTVLEDAGAQTVTPWATGIDDGDGGDQTLSFEVTANTNPGLFAVAPAVSPTGALTYTPAANANGVATITLVLHDDGGTANGGVDTSAAQTFVINVTAVNDAPAFTRGSNVTVLQNAAAQTINPWATAISAGPADEAGQALTFEVTGNTNPALFSAPPSVSQSGALTFTPATNVAGTATLTLVLHDDGGTANGGVNTSAAQTFTISVTAVNQAPSFTKGPDQAVNEDASPQVVTPWASAISQGPGDSGQALTFVVTGNSNPTLFSVAPTVSPSGALSYTPAPDANGSATITLELHDDGGTADGGVDTSAAQTFTITVNAVNDPPSFTKGPDVSVLEDSGPQTVDPWATAISAGPADESAQTVAFNITANTNPGLFAAAPVVSAGGALSFTPAANTAGSATITLLAKDNGGTANGGVDSSAAQTFTITVLFVNHAPTFTPGGNVAVNEDSGAYSAAWASAIDDGDAGVTQALNFIVGNDNLALFTAQPAISASGVLSFTPAPDANGSAQVTVRLHDDGGTANGGVDTSAAQTFTITVNAVNDAPSFLKGADVSVLEDSGPHTVDPWATAISAGPADESAQTVAFNVTANTNPGLFAVAPVVSASGALSFTPAPNTAGSATITLVAKDNGGTANGGVDSSAAQTFTITVLFVNHAPTFTPGGNVTVNEDSAAYAAAWASALDDGDTGVTQALDFIVGNDNAALFAAPPAISATGVLSFTPAPDANGSAQVTVRLHDDGGTADGGVDTSAPQTFTITVNAVNDPPSFAKGPDVSVLEDSGPQTVNPWATAISAGPANESAQTVAFNVTANTNPGLFAVAPVVSAGGALSFTPAANTAGSATITLLAKDSGGTANGGVDSSAAQTFTITVLFVNHAPTFTPGGNVSVNEDSGAYAAAWASALDDGDAGVTQALDFIVSNDNIALFAAPPAISASGVLSFTPAPDANGSAQVTVRLHDDGGTANGGADTSAAQTFTISVNPVNDPPVAVAHVLQTHSGIGIVIGAGDSGLLKDGATDIDNAFGDLSVGATFTNIIPAGATVALLDAATGAYRYDPPPGYHGAASFDYSVCDNGIPTPPAQCASATVSVTVTGPDLWFVDAAAPAGGTGRLVDPFRSLASLPAARGAGDRIFVASGTYASGHTLNDGEELIGAGASGSTFDTLFGVVVPATGTLATRPALGGTAPTLQGTVTLADDARLQGVAIASGASAGLVASGKTNLKVSQSSVTSSTTAVDIANSSAGASGVSLTTTTSSGGATGIKLASLGSGGSFDLGTGSLNGNTATAFSLASASASVSYTGDIGPAAGGRPVDISGVGGAGTAISLGGSIVASVGIRVVNNSSGMITFSGASQKLTTTTGTAVDLGTNTGATVNFSGGGLVVATTSGAGFSAVGGGTVSVTGNGNAIASGTGTAVKVQNTNIGGAGMRFQSVASSGATNGIVLAGTGVGAFTVDGGGASDPANPTRGRTTAKQGGGTLTLGAGGTLNASSGIGVSLANVGGDVLLRNMVVQGGAAEGIKADVVSGLRLDNVHVAGHANFSGLAGTAVNGLTLQHVEFQGNGTSASAGSNHYWGIRFGQRSPCGACADGLAGVATVTNSLITNANEYVFGIVNRNNSVLNLTLANNQISDTASGGAGAFAFSAETWNGANVSITATGNLFSNSRSTAFNYAGNDSSGGGTINLSGNQFANNGVDAGIAHQGQGKTLTFTMDNNVTRQTLVPNSSVSLSGLVGGVSNAATQLRGTMSNNMIGNTSIADSGSAIGAGMAVEARGPGTLTLRADGNKVSQVRQDTAFLVSANTDISGTNRLNLSASNNDLRSSTTSGLGYSGLELYSGGNGGGDNTHLCAHLAGNVAFVGDPFVWGVGAENLAAASDIALEGYAGATNNVSALRSYLNTTATTVTPSAAVALAAGTIKAAPGPCPIP